ncbi:MAG TPA: ABC transporter ATP-binding protein [Bordetella sp.]
MLVLEDIRGGYDETPILNGISLTLEDRRIMTVAGTNGAGKSTLAKAIVGLLPRVEGRILLDGNDLRALPVERRMGMGLAYVPQVANVFPSLTILVNLQVVVNVPRQAQRIGEMFAMFPLLRQRASARAQTLSGGERQQLAFARSLMTRPTLMILDEPTAALSPSKVKESFERIARLPEAGVSVLIIEQRARESLAISDTGCIMDAGRVALAGKARELLDNPRAAELYLGQA